MRLAAALLVLCLPAFLACAPADAEPGAAKAGGRAASASASDKASAEDEKAIAECISDNKTEGARREVVLKYCTCMNDQMEDHETLSISEWEKNHPASVKACDKVAGWK
ncbi:hypothetical protein [Caenimonas sedimenti]|uniref:hypothetical protein n=1 Tax=Caenimonas sedimenti TaxID=2596921 RepID=UPI001645D569|nr:hypothetical protein [Caenimonas sedimenti]